VVSKKSNYALRYQRTGADLSANRDSGMHLAGASYLGVPMKTRPLSFLLVGVAAQFLVACEPDQAMATSPQSSSIALSADGQRLYLALADHDEVRAIDTTSHAVLGSVAVVGHPHRVTVLPDGRVAVTARHAGTVSVINMAEQRVDATVLVGSDPFGVVAYDGDLLVAVSGEGDVARIELDGEPHVSNRIVTEADEPRGIAVRKDGKVLVSHYSGQQVAVLDVAREQQVGSISTRLPSKPFFFPNQQDQITLSPDDSEVAVPNVQCNNDPAQFGSNQSLSGALPAPIYYAEGPVTGYPAIVPSVARLDADGELLLSDDRREPVLGYVNEQPGPANPNINPLDKVLIEDVLVNGPTAVAFVEGGAAELVVAKGSGNVIVRRSQVSSGQNSIIGVVDVGVGADSIVVSPDGRTAFVYNAFDYSIHSFAVPVVAAAKGRFGNGNTEPAPTIGAIPVRHEILHRLAAERFVVADQVLPANVMAGRVLFHAADQRLTRNGAVSCNGCHSEGSDDQTTWTFAEGPRNSPPLWGGIMGTEPFHWDGSVRDIADISRVTIIGRMGGSGLGSADMRAIGAYLDTIPAPAPRLTAYTAGESVDRGAVLFAQSCQSCHTGANLTDNRAHDVGTGSRRDRSADLTNAQNMFGTPPLKGIAHTAPYLHDGSSPSLRALIMSRVVGAAPGTAMTTSKDPVAWSEQDINDVIAYMQLL
jgi:YVTN family beta-propeller protein